MACILISTDYGTWYSQACQFLKLKHHLHSIFEKSIIERTIQYIKDRTEGFEDYFRYRKKNYKLKHVTQWLKLCSSLQQGKSILTLEPKI